MPVQSKKKTATTTTRKPAAKAAPAKATGSKFVTEGEAVKLPSGKGGVRTQPDNLNVIAGPFYIAQAAFGTRKEGQRVRITVEFI